MTIINEGSYGSMWFSLHKELKLNNASGKKRLFRLYKLNCHRSYHLVSSRNSWWS